MRFTSVCTIAAIVPTRSDATARPHTAGLQSTPYSGNVPTKMRSSAANPAALVADPMNAVTGVGAP